MVTAGEGRETLDVHPEQPRERVGLGLAEGRELSSDVLHGTVPLAQLDPGEPTGADRSCRGGEAVLAQRLDERLGASGRCVPRCVEAGGIPLLESADAGAGEVADGGRTGVCLQVAQHLDGERVVVGLERAVPGIGHDVGARWAPAPAAPAGGLVRHDSALLDEGVEVAADRGRRQVEVTAQLGGRDRAVGGDHVENS